MGQRIAPGIGCTDGGDDGEHGGNGGHGEEIRPVPAARVSLSHGHAMRGHGKRPLTQGGPQLVCHEYGGSRFCDPGMT
jgi:hypothetical protein